MFVAAFLNIRPVIIHKRAFTALKDWIFGIGQSSGFIIGNINKQITGNILHLVVYMIHHRESVIIRFSREVTDI